MTDPLIDVVVATHDERRPVERVVASALLGAEASVRVTVVAHEISGDLIAERLSAFPQECVRVLEYRDGVRSPAGPMNHGLRSASARYVTLIGSDDVYEPGAMAAYPRYLDREPDVLVLPLRHQHGGVLRNPLPRWGRRRNLHPARDRLFYRSAPLALIRREVLEQRDELLTPGYATGEDLDLSTWLWSTARRIDFPVEAPAYVIGGDAEERVTTTSRPVVDALAPLQRLLTQSWLQAQPQPVRGALAMKIARIHLFSAVEQRPDASRWSVDDMLALQALAAATDDFGPGFDQALTRSEASLWRAMREGADAAELISRERRRHTDAWARRTLTRNPAMSLARESMARRYLLYRFDRWGAS